MLDLTDAQVIKDWLGSCLSRTPGDGKPTPSQLAKHCGVTAQAVNGWVRTGRITKSNVEKAAQFLGRGPDFLRPGSLTARESGSPAWPLPSVTPSRFNKLPAAERAQIDHFALFVLQNWEQAGSGTAAA